MGLSLQESYYIMTVGIERAGVSGSGAFIETKLFKCPVNLPGKGWILPGSGWCGAA